MEDKSLQTASAFHWRQKRYMKQLQVTPAEIKWSVVVYVESWTGHYSYSGLCEKMQGAMSSHCSLLPPELGGSPELHGIRFPPHPPSWGYAVIAGRRGERPPAKVFHAKEGLVSGLEKGLTWTAGGRELFSSPTCDGESTNFAGGDFQQQTLMQRWLWPLRTEIPDLAGCCDSLRESAVPCHTALRFPSSLISDSAVTDHHSNEAMAELHKGG